MEELNPRKIFWHSRRGMLELDLLLVPFSQIFLRAFLMRSNFSTEIFWLKRIKTYGIG